MDSSTTTTKHGWPKSAPPRVQSEGLSQKKEVKTLSESTSMNSYMLPRHDSNSSEISVPTRAGSHRQRNSIHFGLHALRNNLPTTRRPRISLPNNISSSTITSNRRAVLIGVTYTGTRGISYRSDSIDHVLNLFRLLTVKLRFRKDNVWVLTDAPEKAVGCPVKLGATHQNILTSLKWLVTGSTGGDILFFGFSGLSGTVTKKGPKREVLSEDCLLPSDYPASPPVSEYTLSSLFARELHINASLTAVLDSRDASKVLKLPFIQSVCCRSKSFFVAEVLADDEGPIETGKPGVARSKIFDNRLKKEYNQIRRHSAEQKRESLASTFSKSGKVIAFGFSGIPEQKKKTSKEKSMPIGALTQAFVNCISQSITGEKGYTYESVLINMRHAVATKRFMQLPQVFSSHRLDVYARLALLGMKGSSHI